ncbi:hypothetical protein BDV06DRAFT_227080 [Aspergillus oleicola]
MGRISRFLVKTRELIRSRVHRAYVPRQPGLGVENLTLSNEQDQTDVELAETLTDQAYVSRQPGLDVENFTVSNVQDQIDVELVETLTEMARSFLHLRYPEEAQSSMALAQEAWRPDFEVTRPGFAVNELHQIEFMEVGRLEDEFPVWSLDPTSAAAGTRASWWSRQSTATAFPGSPSGGGRLERRLLQRQTRIPAHSLEEEQRPWTSARMTEPALYAGQIHENSIDAPILANESRALMDQIFPACNFIEQPSWLGDSRASTFDGGTEQFTGAFDDDCAICLDPLPNAVKSHKYRSMRSNYSLGPNHDDGTYEAESWRWDESPQYAPTPGNFGHTPSSPSHFSYIDTNPTTPAEFLPPQTNSPRTNKLPLLQIRDWVEGKSYDEDPPSCIHYWIEWKITLNKRTVIKDTEQDLVLAPGFYWRLFLQPKLREKLDAKYPHKKIVIDDTSIMLAVPRVDKVDQQFPKTDINWSEIEKQLFEWGHHFQAGKKLKLIIAFNYIEDSQGSTASRRLTDKRGTSSATQGMLQELDREVNTEEELTGEPAAWRHVYAMMRCPGSCELGPHCWQDPYGKKHYKLYRDEILSLVSYVKSGKRLESHEDVPGMIREQIYRAERRRLEGQKGHNRLASESAYPPITITNVLPTQTSQQAISSSSSSPSSEGMSTSSANTSRLNLTGLRDANVQAYCDWQQSQVGHASWKVEFQKACDVALNNGLDLDQIDELSDPDYFESRGVKWGIARRFVKDIRFWAETRICNVDE